MQFVKASPKLERLYFSQRNDLYCFQKIDTEYQFYLCNSKGIPIDEMQVSKFTLITMKKPFSTILEEEELIEDFWNFIVEYRLRHHFNNKLAVRPCNIEFK